MQQVPMIGPYQIVAELGRGGMGVVYEVSDASLPGRRLALKQILKNLCGPEALRRFAREAEMLAKIQHPNVVRVYACTLDPVAYLVTELVEGQDLQSLCVREHLEPERCAEIAAQLCDAVGALHGAGIIHRDLKPENAILRPDGTPVLLDFGLARELDGEGLTRTGEVLGTPAYMSPEQADAAKDVDERTDVYGLGAILFQLLAGRAPFQAESLVRLLYKVLQEEPNWKLLEARDVPSALIAVVQRGMEKERDDRYPSAQALAAELRRFLAGEAVLAQPRKRSKGPLLAGLGLLLGGAAALGWVLHSQSPPPSPPATPPATPQTSASEAAPDPLLGIRTSRAFREKLEPKDQLALIEPFLERLGDERRAGAVERMRSEPLWELSVQPGIKRGAKENLERGVIFLPDRTLLTWHGRTKGLVRVSENGGKLWELELPHIANSCALAPDGSVWAFESTHLASRVIPTGGDWSPTPSVEPIRLKVGAGQNRIVKIASFAPSKTRLALGLGGRGQGGEGTLLVDLAQEPFGTRFVGQPPQANSMTEALAWSPDSRLLYLGGEGTGPKKVMTFGYLLAEEEPRLVFEGPQGLGDTVTTYDMELLGQDLIVAQRDGYVRRIHDLPASPRSHQVTFLDSEDINSGGKTHGSEVVGILATSGGDWLYTVAGHFASGDTHGRRERNQVRVWSRDLATGDLKLHATITYASAARRACLSADDGRLALICVDGKVRLYDAWLLRQ